MGNSVAMDMDDIQTMPPDPEGGYLEGQFLIAMPGMGDPNFERSVVYLCAHNADGALGLVINKQVGQLRFSDLLSQLSIEKESSGGLDRPVLFGGPVETGRGFVLHTSDYVSENSTLKVTPDVGLTGTLDILKALASGRGPDKALFILGYAGWAPGQLEAEIQSNGWLHCGNDLDLLFGAPIDDKYMLALKKLGIDPAMLSASAGRA